MVSIEYQDIVSVIIKSNLSCQRNQYVIDDMSHLRHPFVRTSLGNISSLLLDSQPIECVYMWYLSTSFTMCANVWTYFGTFKWTIDKSVGNWGNISWTL